MDLGWTADGIERALAVGGVPLEVYRRPGFEAGRGVRRSDSHTGGAGMGVDYHWPERKDEERSRTADRLPPR